MERLRMLSLMLVTMLTVSLAVSASAFAEEPGNPLILPEPTENAPLKFTSIAGAIKFHFLSATLECVSGSSSGEFTSKRLGKISMSAKRCESPSYTCHTPGDEKGMILFANADLHLVATGSGSSLGAALVVKLASTLKIECSSGGFEWRGSVLGRLSGVSGKTKTAKLKSLPEGECELDREFCLEGSSHRKFGLEIFSAGEFVTMSMEREDALTFEKEVLFDY